MTATLAIAERRTSADIVFEQLFDRIMSLDLLPGTKISEADIADQFGVSRQPVREAFNRLANKGLVNVRPQRATVVQPFSLESIDMARFVRRALERELLRAACERWSDAFNQKFQRNLEGQKKAAEAADADRFHDLDEEFHALIASAAGREPVFDLVIEQKRMVDRICVLSLKEAREMTVLIQDHDRIFSALQNSKLSEAEAALDEHLSRIEKTIQSVHKSHQNYFVG